VQRMCLHLIFSSGVPLQRTDRPHTSSEKLMIPLPSEEEIVRIFFKPPKEIEGIP